MAEQLGNNPPFAIGQGIVCVDPVGDLIKGQQFHAEDVFQCPCCGQWQVTLTEKPYYGLQPFICGPKCSTVLKVAIKFRGAHAQRFAPIQPAFTDATIEILENFKPYEGAETWLPIKKQKEELA